jgi:hypothetical protein
MSKTRGKFTREFRVAVVKRSAGRLLSNDSHLDKSSSGDPSASCSTVELASVSPTTAILLNIDLAVQRFFRLPS